MSESPPGNQYGVAVIAEWLEWRIRSPYSCALLQHNQDEARSGETE
jgi:hypothetical protein